MGMTTPTELRKYRCHKVVDAFKIGKILSGDIAQNRDPDSPRIAILAGDEGLPQVSVPESFLAKHNPEVGGYYVRYEDEYQSYSPAKAFEAGYTRIDQEPLRELVDSLGVVRRGDVTGPGVMAIEEALATAKKSL